MNYLKYAVGSCLCCLAITLSAMTIEIEEVRFTGPIELKNPVMLASTDVNGKEWNFDKLLETFNFNPAQKGNVIKASDIPSSSSPSLNSLSFDLENVLFTKADVEIEGVENYALLVDGEKCDGKNLRLNPATHTITLNYISGIGDKEQPVKVKINVPDDAKLQVKSEGKRRFTLDDVLHGTHIRNVELSPSGNYSIIKYATTLNGGKTVNDTKVMALQSGAVMTPPSDKLHWVQNSDKAYYTKKNSSGISLYTWNPQTNKEECLASNIPEGDFQLSPTEDYLIYNVTEEGPKEDADVYEIVTPEDRQPGWRDRNSLWIYSLEDGTYQPLTFGYLNVRLLDISRDGKKILIHTTKLRLEKRPTTIFSLYIIDMDGMKLIPVVEDDGFVMDAAFSPDGSKVAVTGSPEAFGGIGKNLPEGRIPSTYDAQLFIVDIAGGNVKTLTKDFNPSIENFIWNPYDGLIWAAAADRDLVQLFSINPQTGDIKRIPVEEENVQGFSLAANAPQMIWHGQSVSNSDALYSMDIKKMKSRKLEEPSKERLSDVELGACEAWDFVNSNGDTICGRFYLPPNFDASKKYPLIVNYYGGCTPIERCFESRYPHHIYAAQDYVVYVIEPSGCIGFGQEFSSRHVNTAGKGVAEDIIEGTQKFCEEHPYVDSSKIGCIGASYGGFMTQYLQTLTDIFAAAVSHAGISDNTSYWGEGYWGYSYSETSMAESYPWSHRDLYVGQSPLYNADKVNTPILFLHGDADKNVPVGESIQMYTAMKLLGKDAAFVAVKDQDHLILDYDKRKKWQATILAWFAKYLKDSPQWWDTLYPSKTL